MGIFKLKSSLDFTIKEGKIIKVYAPLYKVIEMILNKLNLRPNFIIENNNTADFTIVKKLFKDLEEHRFQIVPTGVLINPWLYGKKLIIGNTLAESKIVIIVPIIKKSRFNFSLVMLLQIVSFPIIILIFYGLIKVLKFKSRKWGILYIYQVFIGISVEKPMKLSENATYLLLAVLSIIYWNIFFATLEDMRVVTDEENFDSYQDIIDSKMEVHSTFNASDHDTENIKKLLFNRIKVESYDKSIEQLIETQKVICVAPLYTAMYYVKHNVDIQRRPVMKFARTSFHHQYGAFPYEKAFPFAERFDKIIQHIKEAGLMKFQEFKENVTVHSLQKKSSIEETGDTIIEQLLVILSVGFFFATLIFLWETNC